MGDAVLCFAVTDVSDCVYVLRAISGYELAYHKLTEYPHVKKLGVLPLPFFSPSLSPRNPHS